MGKALFITTSELVENTGGGKVSCHEYSALKKYFDAVDVYTGSCCDIATNTPEMNDFEMSMKINESYDLAHFNGHPFIKTIRSVKYHNKNCKIVTSVPAHNLERSIDEHKQCGIDYEKNYPHMIGNNFIEYARQDIIADAVIYPSAQSRDYLINRLGLTNKQYLIPHGCYTGYSIPNYPKDVTFGYIGVRGIDKGTMYLHAVINKCKDIPFYTFGSTKRNHVGDNVTDYGNFRTLDDIMPLYSVGIYPTITEGFNLGALEGMAYGRPVIISEGAGFAEYVTDGVNGFVVPIRDVDALIEKVKYFVKYPDEVVRMGAKAYEFSKLFDWNKVEEEYVKVYKELME